MADDVVADAGSLLISAIEEMPVLVQRTLIARLQDAITHHPRASSFDALSTQ